MHGAPILIAPPDEKRTAQFHDAVSEQAPRGNAASEKTVNREIRKRIVASLFARRPGGCLSKRPHARLAAQEMSRH